MISIYTIDPSTEGKLYRLVETFDNTENAKEVLAALERVNVNFNCYEIRDSVEDNITASKYVGISYPKIFYNRFFKWLWKKYMCPRGRHLLDEVWSPDDHYLYCDACGLYIYIKSIETDKEE